jgi:3-oxoacyl-[acyl-carrier-protein] synthase II
VDGEAAAAALTIHHGLIPPTAGYEEPDPEITIRVVHGEPLSWDPSAALSNSFGFGGHNGCLVLLPPG